MNSKKARDIILWYLYLYGVAQILLVKKNPRQKEGPKMGKSGVEHDNHDINIQKNHTYETLQMFLLSILSELSLVSKIYGNIVNFRKSMFLM